MKKFFIHTMGCKSNQFESAIIEENLISAGFEKSDPQAADYFILNSCSVTHKSDNEALRLLRSAKAHNPEVKTVITGCLAQIERQKLLDFPFINLVIGNDEKLNLIEHLDKKCAADALDNLNEFHEALLADTSKSRAGVKIQDGCDNRCAYCIIPFARGKNRSASAKFVLEQISQLEKSGFLEVVLTGIHIGQWGLDFGSNLLTLLREIEEKSAIKRFRLGSLNPLEINDEMLEFLSKSEKFCPHFHLSLQSACDNTLKRMNRFYKVEDYLKLIEKINDKFELPFLGSDIIAGFVGETDADFENTLANLKRSGLSRIHVFPYSIRKGTQAETLDGHLSNEIKQNRTKIIQKISDEKFKSFAEKNIGTVQEVLVEKHFDKSTGLLKGVTRNYLKVFLEGGSEKDFNTLKKVKLQRFEAETFYGKIL